MNAPQPIDFVARLADAWDGRGNNALTPPTEHRALLSLANLPPSLALFTWAELSGAHRYALVVAARQAIELGRASARIFGA